MLNLPDNQNGQISHIGWQGVQEALDILWQVQDMSFVPSLTSMFAVNTHDGTSSGNKHFLNFCEALQLLWNYTRVHVILS